MPSIGLSVSERWEAGGEFHWMGLPAGNFLRWPEPACWHLLGRHSLVALLRSLPRASRRLWLPTYFCFDIGEYWKRFIEVVSYSDDPRRPEPEWCTLQPGREDVVVAVNYFGVRSGDLWRSWHASNDCVLVEDHSHDPISGWAMRSLADYAFASLRKTLPVPDGGILWSPRGLPLPPSGVEQSCVSAQKLAAMLWKREYLYGSAPADAKRAYRAWQLEGEAAFSRADVSFATGLTQQYLRGGVPAQWRAQRANNTQLLLANLAETEVLRPIFSDWPEDAAPLGAVFEFRSPAQRDAMRQKLQDYGVYCAVHWPPTGDCDPAARDLAGRLLTIPTDQRYDARDMEKLATVVTAEAYGIGTDSVA